jgi:hypothetical protein
MAKAYIVVGLGHKSGNYEGRDYDNTMVHCTYEDELVAGVAVKTVKVKSRVFMESPCKVGDAVDFNFDEYRNVKEIVILVHAESGKGKNA